VQVDLDKLDAVRSRVGVSYEAARNALERANGDVVAAVIDLEKQRPNLLTICTELLEEIVRLVDGRTPRKLRFKLGDRLVKEYPVALGVAAAFAVGLLATLISKASIEIERDEKDSEGA